jgi:hypothetical protein
MNFFFTDSCAFAVRLGFFVFVANRASLRVARHFCAGCIFSTRKGGKKWNDEMERRKITENAYELQQPLRFVRSSVRARLFSTLPTHPVGPRGGKRARILYY